MRSLCFDPGLKHLGYAAFDGPELLDYGAFVHSPDEGDHVRRVSLYYADAKKVFDRLHPLVLVIEDQQPPGRSAGGEAKARFTDLIAVARMVGRLWGLADGTDCEVRFVNPTRAKMALTGFGKADKSTMVRAATQQYGIECRTQSERETVADAIGIGLAALAELRKEALGIAAQGRAR